MEVLIGWNEVGWIYNLDGLWFNRFCIIIFGNEFLNM